MNKTKEKIETFLTETPVSRLFWYGMVYLAFIITACINLELAGVISGIGSLFLFAAFIDGDDDIDLFWAPLTVLFWVILVIAGICFGLFCLFRFIYMHTLKPFNEWLDSLRKKK